MKELIAMILTCTLLSSCCRPPDLDGLWIATSKDHDRHALLHIEGDSLSLMHCFDLFKESHAMRLTCDSLMGPYDRLAYHMIGDTIHLDRGMIMYRPVRIEQADMRSHIHQVHLFEASANHGKRPASHFTPFFLGPCTGKRECPETFLGGHGLGIQDQWADAADLTEWLEYAKTDWPKGAPIAAVIYPDTSVSLRVVNELADRIHSGLNGDVTVYQGFFYPQAEYFLTFDVIRKAGGVE